MYDDETKAKSIKCEEFYTSKTIPVLSLFCLSIRTELKGKAQLITFDIYSIVT